MLPVLLKIILWALRVLRILIILRCLASCFSERSGKGYKVFRLLTLPVVIPIEFLVLKIFKTNLKGFDWCTLFVYAILVFVSGIVVGKMVSMGLV